MLAELLALGRESQKSRAPIGSVHTALNKPLRHELLDQEARAVAVNGEPCSEPVLLKPAAARLLADIEQGGELQRCKVPFGDGL